MPVSDVIEMPYFHTLVSSLVLWQRLNKERKLERLESCFLLFQADDEEDKKEKKKRLLQIKAKKRLNQGHF